MPDSPVAVTAMGAVTALGIGPDRLFQGLLGGNRAISSVRAFGVEGCRVQLAAEVTCAVPCVTSSRTADLAVLAIRDALSRLSSGWQPERVGLVLGSAGAQTALLERRLSGGATGPKFALQYSKGHVVDEIARVLGLSGPRQVINTACSSGAVAIAIAADWLRDNECDWAIAVGADELGRFTYTGFHALRAMDPEPSRSFDRNRRGLTMGEGAGAVVLERVEDVERRGSPMLGLVCSVGHACDAHHLTAPDPTGEGQARALRAALGLAGLTPADVGFVNAHGTGTPLNDSAEVASLELGLGARAASCPLHSVKSTIGHCMGAAGAIEAVVALKSLEMGLVPPTAGLVDSEFEGRVNCIKDAPLRVQADYAISTSFGFGGNDAALVLGRAHAGTRAARVSAGSDVDRGASLERIWVTGGCFVAPVVNDESSVSRLFAIDPLEVLGPERTRRLDPLSQRCLCIAERALGSAGLERRPASGSPRCDGVIVGSALGATVTSVRYAERLVKAGAHATNPIDFPDSIDGAMAAHLALDLNLVGPSLTFVSGQRSASAALSHAARLIARGRAERLLVVVGDYLAPLFVDALTEEAAVSGTHWAEALFALVLERPGLRAPTETLVTLEGFRGAARGVITTQRPTLCDPSGVLEIADAWLRATEGRGDCLGTWPLELPLESVASEPSNEFAVAGDASRLRFVRESHVG